MRCDATYICVAITHSFFNTNMHVGYQRKSIEDILSFLSPFNINSLLHIVNGFQ